MTPLGQLLRDIDSALATSVARLPTVEQQILATGLHPITSASEPGHHALPWTPDLVLQDANDGLDGLPAGPPVHVDRASTLPRLSLPLVLHEITAAEWVIGALTA